MHEREGAMVKKHIVFIDGKNLEEEDFAIEVVGSMGALETTNLFTVDNMKTRLKKSIHMIAQLQSQLKNTEKNIREEINKGLEQDRVVEKQEIQMLKYSLDEIYKKMKKIQEEATHQEDLERQLHERLNSIQNQGIDLKVFQV